MRKKTDKAIVFIPDEVEPWKVEREDAGAVWLSVRELAAFEGVAIDRMKELAAKYPGYFDIDQRTTLRLWAEVVRSEKRLSGAVAGKTNR